MRCLLATAFSGMNPRRQGKVRTVSDLSAAVQHFQTVYRKILVPFLRISIYHAAA